jgi:hypothetical protein
VYFSSNATDADDGALVARCLREDAAAFRPLVERYQRPLFNVAFRILGDYGDARDATQNASVKAYEKLGSYDPAYRFFRTRGRQLLRQRGERLERPCAHLYRTGRMRRTHVRGHVNILKRLLIHAGGCNLALLMRTIFGVGTPRSLQGRAVAALCALWDFLTTVETALHWLIASLSRSRARRPYERELPVGPMILVPANPFTTGC